MRERMRAAMAGRVGGHRPDGPWPRGGGPRWGRGGRGGPEGREGHGGPEGRGGHGGPEEWGARGGPERWRGFGGPRRGREGWEPWEGRRGRGDRMERGVLRYLLLDALRDGPKHGYEVIKWLEKRTHGLYVPSPGTVYPTLQLLEDQGLVVADREDDRRVYRLTSTGQAELDAHADAVQAVWARFPDHEGSTAGRHEMAFLQDELNDLVRTVWGGLRGALHRGDADQVRRVRQALERCKNEVREIIARATGAPDERSEHEPPAAPPTI